MNNNWARSLSFVASLLAFSATTFAPTILPRRGMDGTAPRTQLVLVRGTRATDPIAVTERQAR